MGRRNVGVGRNLFKAEEMELELGLQLGAKEKPVSLTNTREEEKAELSDRKVCP